MNDGPGGGDAFAARGFAFLPGVLKPEECSGIRPVRLPEGSVGGSRCLLSHSWCAKLAKRLRCHDSLGPFLPSSHVAVQCTYFEKSASRNWLVPVHQDLSIPVADRVEAEGLRGWSDKEGSVQVQAPVALLEQLVAVRLHIDPCSEEDGPLRVVPASHLLGVVCPESAVRERAARGEVVCEALPGDALVMRPLLLHASSKARAQAGSRRRVLHFLFGPPSLPHGLRWAAAV
jgi:hypothetical protein